MADENISDAQRKLSAAMQQQADDYARYGQMQVSTSDQLRDAQVQAATGMKNFTAAGGMAGKALGALAGAGIASAQAMYQGKKGMGAFNSSLDSLSEAATIAGAALTLLIPGGIVMKAVIGGLTMAATAAIAYTKAANDMADKLYKSYSGLAQSGAAASDGMTGVFEDAKKLGLSMDELDSMVGLVAANSQELALMSGSVSQGRKDFAKMGEAMESSRAGFFKMGISQEAQNESLMRYTRNQTLSGRAQNMTSKEMADGARAYILEQDKLAKLTGMSAKKQQDLLDRARENEQFNAKLRKLELEGTTESLAAAERLKQGLQVAAMAGDESAEAFMASVNGNLRSEAARKANLTTSGAYLQYARDLESGAILDAAKGFEKVAGAGADYEKSIGVNLSALDAGANIQMKTSTMQKLALINQIGLEAAQKKIEEDQLKQQKGQGDGITNAQGNMIKTQQEINKKLEQDVFKGIPNAQANMARLANVTDTLANGFTLLTNGINRLLKLVGLGEKEPEKPKEMTKAEIETAAATTDKRDKAKPLQDKVSMLAKELDADEKALKDAKRAGKFGDELKPLEEKILKNKQEYDAAAKQLLAAEKEIALAAQEEKKLRFKQMQDRKKLANLERQNLNDAEEIKDLNEEKANLVKAGKDVTAVDKKIEDRKANIAGRSAEVGQLQADLKTSTVAPKSAGSPAAAGGANPTSATTLANAGIKIKKGDVQKEGADLSPKIIDLAKNIQSNIEGFAYFSGFNDNFHNEKASSSKHTKGLAADFALTEKPDPKRGQQVVSYLKEQGASLAIDEYNNPSAKATAGHIHVEIPTFAEGGDLAAGKLGIVGEAGAEFVEGPASVTPMGDIMGVFTAMATMMGQQAGALDELVRIAKSGNDISTKILRSAN